MFDKIVLEEIARSSETFTITFNAETYEYMATCLEYPLLSAFAKSPEKALTDLRMLIELAKEIQMGGAVPKKYLFLIQHECYHGSRKINYAHIEVGTNAKTIERQQMTGFLQNLPTSKGYSGHTINVTEVNFNVIKEVYESCQ